MGGNVDWENVAEQIESLGASERRALASLIGTVIEHLMKLQASPAEEPRNAWRRTIGRARDDIERVLEDSPSLRRELPGVVETETARARWRVAESMADHGEDTAGLAALTFDDDSILGR